MLKKLYIITLIASLGISSCAIRKHIPQGDHLYNGATVTVNKTADNPVKTRPVKKSLAGITFPRKNKMILGYPYKLGFWYGIGKGKKEKGFRNWLRNRLGEPPVLGSSVDLEANAENMTAWLENRGYFRSVVSGSSSIKGYRLKADYTVKLTRPYIIDSVAWSLDSSKLSKAIMRVNQRKRNEYVEVSKQFDLEDIKAETRNIDLVLKNRGYYYFSPDYIKAYVDTTKGNYKASIIFSIKNETPLLARTAQRINSIMLFPNYTLLEPPPDTAKTGLEMYEGVFIRDTVKAFKASTLVDPFNYKVGDLYNLRRHNQTLNRFINLGAFKFVKSRYEPSTDTVSPNHMDVFYYLTPMKKKTLSAEIGGFTKSNSFTGSQLNVNWKNRNFFRGAEQFNIKGYGAFELSINDSLKKNNNWRLGGEASLLIPRFVTFFKIKENNYFPPYTKFTLGYEWMRRQLLYTKNLFRFQYDLNWKVKSNIEHTLSPVSIMYNNATAFSEEYLEKVNRYPALQYANLPELIPSTFYNFNTRTNPRKSKNILYFNGSVDVAGNIAGLIRKADAPFTQKIAGAYFAQYAKFDADLRFTRKLTEKSSWVSRFEIGMGLPYGNSAYLPFSKQFIIGGANSLRGFRPRQLGPGRVLTTADQQVSYPQIGGDIKLELQSELRFPLFGIVNGAVFAETGNVWLRNDFLYGSDGQFGKKFLNDLAVDAGIGVRVDISVLVIRLDLATPLRKPYLQPGAEWILSEFDPGSRQWRRDNLVLNLGIGYPF